MTPEVIEKSTEEMENFCQLSTSVLVDFTKE